jgi:AraC family transcriptional regulator of adaptative response / DNA-3-methyladenine glycosylase II
MLRRRIGAEDPRGPVSDERPRIALRLRTRAPFDAVAIRAHLEAHAVPGRDLVDADGSTAHAVDVPGGTAVVRIDWSEVPPSAAQTRDGVTAVGIPVVLTLPQLTDTMPAIQTVRRLLDLDADPAQIADAFARDPLLGDLVIRRPGLRLPAAREPREFALGTVLGQQVSLAAALASGLDLGSGADRDRARAELAAMRGIGPWTVEIIALRALGDPDAYPSGDLILRRALGVTANREAERLAETWRPFRGYATQHLWADFLEAASRKETP